MAKIAVIGSGFSSLSSASYLAKAGHDVTIYEKNDSVGGRCRRFSHEGFTYDMGPSWYWMAEVFEQFFNYFGHKSSDFYELIRISPSYSIQFSEQEKLVIPADFEELKALFESLEPGAGLQLDKFMADAEVKYDAGMNRFVHKPSLSIFEFANFEILKGLVKLDLFKPFSKHVRKYFKHPQILQVLEFPVLFLGATAKEIPALYSLMNFTELRGGTWYPKKGMYEVILAMEKVCKEQGAKIELNATVEELIINPQTKACDKIRVNGKTISVDYVVAGADYEHVDQTLIAEPYRNYSPKYWDTRKLAPSALIYYMGVNKRLGNVLHHNLYFDTDFNTHSEEIYTTKKWPNDPLFYICAPSQTDATVAPEGCENLFLLIPVAPDLKDTEEQRELLFDKVMKRMEKLTGQKIIDHIIFKKSYAIQDFKDDYNAFKGNAYGLANTLRQTAFLKPKLQNKKVKNIYYTGQLTTPGPGIPPTIISGKVVADHLLNSIKKN